MQSTEVCNIQKDFFFSFVNAICFARRMLPYGSEQCHAIYCFSLYSKIAATASARTVFYKWMPVDIYCKIALTLYQTMTTSDPLEEKAF